MPSLSLGTRVRALGESRFALEPDQLEVLDTFAENDRVLVQGGAGSGKTLIAAEAACRHAAGGERVLLLCFTQPLRTWLAERLSGTGVEVQTVSGLAKRIVDAADGLTRTPDAGNEYWRRTYERAGDVCRPEWDVVVVDEGQDLTFEAWCLVGGLARQRLWAFHDPGQGFWGDRSPPPDLSRRAAASRAAGAARRGSRRSHRNTWVARATRRRSLRRAGTPRSGPFPVRIPLKPHGVSATRSIDCCRRASPCLTSASCRCGARPPRARCINSRASGGIPSYTPRTRRWTSVS